MAKNYWLVYRVKDHRLEDEINARIYGWTDSKPVLEAFFEQRDEKKYAIFKMKYEEIAKKFPDEDLPKEEQIDFIKLKSVQTGQEILLFMTLSEMGEAVKRILRLFVELSSLCNLEIKDQGKDVRYFMMLIMNLKDKYKDALEYIGYRPPEIDAYYDSITGTREDENNETIDIAIAEAVHPRARRDPGEIPGASALDDVADKILYSLEAFIKVLREDM
jgi:hypothetical protein